MIHAVCATDIPFITGSECAIRIRSLALAYADTGNIVQYYTDDNGGYMALFDGTAIMHTTGICDEEWIQFLSFVPYVHAVRCGERLGQLIAKAWNCPCETGALMKYTAPCPQEQTTQSDVRLDDIYTLLCAGFTFMPPFDAWYVDVSYRVRHGYCHIACVCRDGKPISSAMTVAETESAVLLGAVVTDPHHRHKGLASACVLSLVREFCEKDVYIAPANDAVATLYAHIGFSNWSRWAQISR